MSTTLQKAIETIWIRRKQKQSTVNIKLLRIDVDLKIAIAELIQLFVFSFP